MECRGIHHLYDEKSKEHKNAMCKYAREESPEGYAITDMGYGDAGSSLDGVVLVTLRSLFDSIRIIRPSDGAVFDRWNSWNPNEEKEPVSEEEHYYFYGKVREFQNWLKETEVKVENLMRQIPENEE